MATANTLLQSNLSRFPIEFNFNYLDLFYQNLVLPFNMEMQTKSNWCWAATSKSVSHYYSRLSPWTQCKIASSELGQTCCTSPVPSPCNVPWYLDRSLQRTQNFISVQGGTISFQEIRNQLNNGFVVGACIGWNSGGGHFMVIYGVSRTLTNEYLYIDDPIYGKSILLYNVFATNYQGSGTWTHTYFTKKYNYFMWLKDLEFNPKLLKPIPEIRPFAKINNQHFNINQLPEPEFSMPHFNYIISLNDINGEMNLPKKPISLRVLEMEDSAPLAVYEVGLDEENPQFLQLNSNKEYFGLFDTAIQTLKRYANQDAAAELRNVRVPALNLEATWLHYEDQQHDRFVLIRNFGDPEREDGQNIFDEKEFKEYLNKKKAQLTQMDDLMGAG